MNRAASARCRCSKEGAHCHLRIHRRDYFLIRTAATRLIDFLCSRFLSTPRPGTCFLRFLRLGKSGLNLVRATSSFVLILPRVPPCPYGLFKLACLNATRSSFYKAFQCSVSIVSIVKRVKHRGYFRRR